MKFKVGQKVVALTNPLNQFCQPRKRGEVYTITAISICLFRGFATVNINNNTTNRKEMMCDCGNTHPTQGRHWTYEKHFAPLEEYEEHCRAVKELTQEILI